MDTSSRISTRFDRFLAQIQPSGAQLAEGNRQVASLKEHLNKQIVTDARFHLEKIFLSGSVAKHTSLVNDSASS